MVPGMKDAGSLLSTAQKPSAWLALVVLALMVLVTQLGALGVEVIDPDESSFILMGADVAKGHLPFVHQFDLKPPVIFLLIGAVIAAAGNSLIAIRLLGDGLLLGCAFATFLAGRRIVSAPAALGGAMLLIAFAALDLGQPTYSELPAAAFTALALWQLARQLVTTKNAAIAGFALALAVLSRTNLYPLPLLIGLALLVAPRFKIAAVAPRAWLAFGLGGLVPVAALLLAYGAAGELAVFKLAMIDVPLTYSQQMGILDVLRSHAGQFYYTVAAAPLLLIPLGFLTAAGLVWAAAQLLRRKDNAQVWPLSVVILTALAIKISLAKSGAAYPHYWLQLLPVLGLFCAFGIEALRRRTALLGIAAAGLVLLSLSAALTQRLPAALDVAADPLQSDARFEIAAAARHIQSTGPAQPSLWAWRKHLIHWYLDAPQLSPAGVHPDNLGRPSIMDPLAEHGYASRDELRRLMMLKPDYVITDAKGIGIDWVRAAGKPVDTWLAANYRLDARFSDVLVYRRIR